MPFAAAAVGARIDKTGRALVDWTGVSGRGWKRVEEKTCLRRGSRCVGEPIAAVVVVDDDKGFAVAAAGIEVVVVAVAVVVAVE